MAALLLLIVFLSALFLPCQPTGEIPAPDSGVQLYNTQTCVILQNNSLVHQSTIGPTKGVSCISAASPVSSATWLDRSGEPLPNTPGNNYVYMSNYISEGYVLLLRTTDIRTQDEGVYTCNITDEKNDPQILRIGLYKSSGPPVTGQIQFQYNGQEGEQDVPLFTLNCITTKYPPTNVTWRRNGTDLVGYETNQILSDAYSTTYNNLLHVSGSESGEYSCQFENSAGSSNEQSIIVIGPPRDLSVELVSAEEVLLEWRSPEQTVRGYNVCVCHHSEWRNNSSCSCTSHDDPDTTEYRVTEGLELGRRYAFTVDSLPLETGEPVLPTMEVVYLTIAGPPRDLSVELVSAEEVLLEWRSPEQTVRGYNVCVCHHSEWRTNSNCSCTSRDDPDTTEYRVTEGLELGRRYAFTVDSLPLETGEPVLPTMEVVYLTIAVPPPPEFTLDKLLTDVSVVWDSPEDSGIVIGSYELSYKGDCETDETVTTVLNGSVFHYELTGLRSGTNYTVSMRANNSLGFSTQTNTTLRTLTSEPPGSPQTIQASSVNSTAVTLSWEKVECSEHNGKIIGYRVSYGIESDNNTKEIRIDENQMQTTLINLAPDTQYLIGVAAENNKGPGNFTFTEVTTEQSPTFAALIQTLIAILASALGGTLLILVAISTVIVVICYRTKMRQKTIQVQDCLPLDTMSISNYLEEPDGVPEPVIEEFPQDTVASEGEYVVFHVRISGNPEPAITWLHNGQSVVSDGTIVIRDDGTLAIPSLEPKHSGTYSVVATNANGSMHKELSLSIEDDEDQENLVHKSRSLMADNKPVPLSSFEQYVARQHANGNEAFQFQFMCLNLDADLPATVAAKPENKTLNRCKNIVPFDDSRVSLSPVPERDDCKHDYINASHVDGYSQPCKFIATQGPLALTVTDFWRMVWQEHCSLIVMLCNIVESNRVRCQQYWPESDSCSYGPFVVVLLEEQTFADYVLRTLKVSFTGEPESTFQVKMFHYTSWPDHGVPDYAGPLLSVHQRVMSYYDPDKGKILVHCSAGVGRTGTFIAIDIALEQARKEDVVDINGIINRMRQQRMKIVQTVAQYIFVHDSVLESVVCGDTQITTTNLRVVKNRLSRADKETGMTGFEIQFQVLQRVTPNPSETEGSDAMRYVELNRSLEFLPRDQKRVVLSGKGPDYIHATFVDGYKQKKAFIVAEGPMQVTCGNFWKMVHQQGCGTIVMLSNTTEYKKEVCCQYWPNGGHMSYGEFTVELIEESACTDNLITRTFSLTHSKTGKGLQVTQFHVLNWTPDGECSNHGTVIKLLEEVLKVQRRTGNKPIIVHCSDTVSRSCIFCAAVSTIERCKTEGVVDVFQVVKALRMQKAGAILTVEQYCIIFDLVVAYLDSLNHYENFR